MRIERAAGRPSSAVFEPGDLVRLRQDEPGPICTAVAGEWGRVLRVQGGRLDVRLAGFSRPRTAVLADVVAIASRFVEPCDHRGRPLDLPEGEVWQPKLRTREA
jgi:hypothetical protein